MTPKFVTVWPEKGGIGKSFVITLLHDYLRERGCRVRAFDLDHANSTLQRFISTAQFIHTEVDNDKLGVLDDLITPLIERTADAVLVDNRAAGGDKLAQWVADTDLLRTHGELGISIVFAVVIVDDKDAISQVATLVERYGSQVSWLVLRNLVRGPTLPLFDASQTRQRLLDAGASECSIPVLAEVTRNRLQLANLTVADGRSDPGLALLDRSRCVRFMNEVAAQLRAAEDLLFA